MTITQEQHYSMKEEFTQANDLYQYELIQELNDLLGKPFYTWTDVIQERKGPVLFEKREIMKGNDVLAYVESTFNLFTNEMTFNKTINKELIQ